ncbi:MAG: helix-turn-helix domain-containing protein [Gammaproteobacteria bacterium]|nr:helix-turn-helix domain-containing protein [Gammaproteobacteria bacterium]
MSNSDDAVVADGDFGSALAEARKAQNYTVEDIYKHLKIPVQIVSAIEASNLDALPGSTYTQGYIRAYAKFLEISDEDILDLYNRAVPDGQITELKPRSSLRNEASQSPLIKMVTVPLLVVGVITVIYGIVQYYQEKAEDMENEYEAKEQSFTGNSLDSPGINTLDIKQNASLTDDGDLIVEDSSSTEFAAEQSVIDIGSEIETDIKPENTVKAADNDPRQDILEINAEKGSWMEVRDANDARLFYNMVPKGGTRTLLGQAPFSISLGNAKTTRLVINDLEIDMTEHIRSNNTAKFKVSSEEQNVIFH